MPKAPDPLIEAERERLAGLFAVAKQADRLGVTLDVAEASRRKTSVRAARRAVLVAAADAETPEISTFAAPGHRAEGSKAADAAAVAWKRALKR